jgi:hypothetical protein
VGKTYQGTATALLHEPKVLQAETFPQISIWERLHLIICILLYSADIWIQQNRN